MTFALQKHCSTTELQGQGDSSRIRTYDRLLRRQLLYPAELLSQMVVPIAANLELPRRLPQSSVEDSHIIRDGSLFVNEIQTANLLENYLNHQEDQYLRWCFDY